MKNTKKYVSNLFLVIFSVLFLLCPSFLFALSDTPKDDANRHTALRCLFLAKDSVTSSDWASAVSEAKLGLSYDSSVSDLWYLFAVARSKQGATRREILSLVTTALSKNEWVDYNRDGARILYADILCDTGRWQQSIDVLDANPFLYSADAEYIRIKSYYCMKTNVSIEKARDKTDADRRVYPDDTRFPLLFFKYEYGLQLKQTPFTERLAKAFVKHLPLYSNADPELEMYAIFFVHDPETAKRMLQSFAARNLRHPLYAIAALKAGLIDQKSACQYFCEFADKTIPLEYLNKFVTLITDKSAKKQFKEYLTAYSGTLTVDTDGALGRNLSIAYKRGRPDTIRWDSDNDGVDEWQAQCDFGEPVSVEVPDKNMYADYSLYPSLSKVVISDKGGKDPVTYNLVSEILKWAPFIIASSPIISQSLGTDFYVPQVKLAVPELTAVQLLTAASSYTTVSPSDPKKSVYFSMLNGVPLTADYSEDGRVYAHCIFKDGRPILRTVDVDGDGIFEKTETYGFDPDNTMHRSAEDDKTCNADLFGLSSACKGLYVKMVQIDTNGDTIPDFTEEYLANGGKISSWDYNNDKLWDVRYVRYPTEAGKKLREETFFYVMPQHELVTVSFEDGKPVEVEKGDVRYEVAKGVTDNFYWLDSPGSEVDEQKVIASLNQIKDQGICVVVENSERRMIAVRIGNNFFSRILENVPIGQDSDSSARKDSSTSVETIKQVDKKTNGKE